MDDQIFKAIYGEVTGAQDQSALVQQLRGQHDMGEFLSVSPTVGNVGRTMQQNALQSARDAGNRRQQGLTRARQARMDDYNIDRDAKKDALDAEALEYGRSGWTNITQQRDAEGNMAMYGLKDGRGELQKIPGSEGLTEHKAKTGGAGAQGWRTGQTPSGAKIDWNVLTKEIMAFGEHFPNVAAFRAKYPNERLPDEAAARMELERSENYGGEQGERDSERVEAAYSSAASARSMVDDYRNMRKLVTGANGDKAAWTSSISQYLPTLTDNTAQFESLKKKLALNNLEQWGLTPVSDKDLAYVLDATVPNLSEENMLVWLDHKEEAAQRMGDVADIMARYYEANRGRRPVGKAKKRLDDDLKAALGDFEFESPVGEDGGTSTTQLPVINGRQVTEDDIATTMKNHNMTRQQVLDKLGGG